MPVVAACLRNTATVGSWLTAHDYGTPERPVAVVAAGERWPDGALRPALGDLLGAGAVTAGVSGRELASTGFAGDVAIAAERDVCAVVPVRDGNGAFAPG